MDRCITVTGTGNYAAKPDLIIVTLSLSALDQDYEKAMSEAGVQIEKLRSSLLPLGFQKDQLKTESFYASAQYESKKIRNGDYQRYFEGYKVDHRLKLELDFDTKKLGRVLSAISKSGSEPEVNIAFGLRDREAACAFLLEDAAKNARRKAEILVKASGVSLGELISVNYSWDELKLFSFTDCYCGNDNRNYCKNVELDIEPEDVKVSDSATFVWKII